MIHHTTLYTARELFVRDVTSNISTHGSPSKLELLAHLKQMISLRLEQLTWNVLFIMCN